LRQYGATLLLGAVLLTLGDFRNILLQGTVLNLR
jgi:hypothetical protein